MKVKSDTYYKIITKIKDIVEAIVLNFIKAYLNTVIGQSFFAKFIDVAVDNFYDQLIDPFMKKILVKQGYNYDRSTGKLLITKLNEATNVEDYNSTADDILGKL